MVLTSLIKIITAGKHPARGYKQGCLPARAITAENQRNAMEYRFSKYNKSFSLFRTGIFRSIMKFKII